MRYWGAMPLAFGVIAAVAVGSVVASGHCWASSQTRQRLVVRQGDVAGNDPILYVTGVWTAPPAGRAIKDQAYYAVEIVSKVVNGPAPVIGFGFLDEPGSPGPVMASYCGGCYDEARGVPAPPGGWYPYGNRGALLQPVKFELSYDPAESRWSWFLNGQFVRSEASSLLAGGSRLRVGAAVAVGEPLREMWFDDIQTYQKHAGWRVFQPDDNQKPHLTVDGSTVGYQATGTVVVHSEGEDPSRKNVVVDGVGSRGGRGGPMVQIRGSGLVFVARGRDIHILDSQTRSLRRTLGFTSTITAMAATSEGVVIGDDGGSVALIRDADPYRVAGRVDVAAPITVVAAGEDYYLAGTSSGAIYHVAYGPETTVTLAVQLDGPVRSLLWDDGYWTAGVETRGYGIANGLVYLLTERDGHMAVDSSIGMSSTPIALASLGDGVILVATRAGEIRALAIDAESVADIGPVYQAESRLITMQGDADRWYLLEENNGVTVIGFDGTIATVLDQNSLKVLGVGVSLLVTRQHEMIVATDAGEVALLDNSDGLVDEPIARMGDIGVVNGLVEKAETVVVLSGQFALQGLSSTRPNDAVLRQVGLARKGIGLRQWRGGIAVVGGYTGVDLYSLDIEAPVLRLRVGGISHDVEIADDTAYVAAGAAGVHVVDISSPEEPIVVTTLASDHPATAVAVSGSLMLVGRQGAGILVFSCKDPKSPQPIGEIRDTANVERFAVHDESVVALTGTGFLLDIRSATAWTDGLPRIASVIRVSRYGIDVESTGRDIIVASGDDGVFRVVEWTSDGVFGLRGVLGGPAITAATDIETRGFAGLGTAGLHWWRLANEAQLYLPSVRRSGE